MLDRTRLHHTDIETRKSETDDTIIPTDHEVKAALDRMISSTEFRASPNLAAFLKFSVETSIAGEGQNIKAYSVATSVLGRPPTFDPQADPIVRVEATRLRRAMERYYLHDGADEQVLIEIPRGRYVAYFSYRSASLPVPESVALSDSDKSGETPETIAESPIARARMTVASMWGNLNRSERRSITIFALAVVGAMVTWTLIPVFQSEQDHVEQALILQPVTSGATSSRTFDITGSSGPQRENNRAIFAMLQLMPLVIGSGHPHARDFGQSVINTIASQASEFEGIPVLDPEMVSSHMPETKDLYSLVGRIGPNMDDESRTDVAFRLLHAETGEIIWTRSFDVDLDQDQLGHDVQDIATSVIASLSGLYGAIRIDDARRHLEDMRDANLFQICLADSDLALRTANPKLIEQTISCLSEFAVSKPAEALIFKQLSALRVALGDHAGTANSDLQRRSRTEAIADLETAIRLQPDDSSARRMLMQLQSVRADES